MGIKLVGGFYVAVGSGPRIMAVATVQNDMGLLAALSSREYRIISTKLMKYDNYAGKVWIPTGMFRDQTFNIQTGAWKFNQYYDIVPGREDEHNRFVKEEAIPMMKELSVPVTHGWRLSIGTEPRILAECTARSFADIAKGRRYRRVPKTFPHLEEAIHYPLQQPDTIAHRSGGNSLSDDGNDEGVLRELEG